MCIVLTAILCISRHVYGRDVEMGVLLDQSEFPSTAMEEFYHLFEYTAFAITTVVVIFTMTVIVMSNTKGISNYRWYLIHTLLWSLFFDGMGTFIGAVTLFPVPCYYGVNLAGTTSDATQTAYFFIGVSAILGKLCSLLFQFEHRYYQTQSSTSRYHRMCSHIQGFMQIVVRFCLIILAMALVLIPFALFFPNQEEQRALLRSLDPVVASLIDQHPSLLCITAGTDVAIILIPSIILICLMSVLCFLTLYIIYTSIRTQFSANTQRLQMMLFWSLVAQMGALFVLLILPLLFFIGSSLLSIRNLPIYSMYCFFPVLCHTSVDCLMILYFIRPYRRFLIKHMTFANTHSYSISHVNVIRILPKFSSFKD